MSQTSPKLLYPGMRATAENAESGAWRRVLQCFACVLFFAMAASAHADDGTTNSPAALRDKYAALQTALGRNQFQRPITLDSTDKSGTMTGNIYALLNTPFENAAAALGSAGNWCDILFLHLNTKYCRVSTTGQGTVLNLRIGKKYDQPLEDAYKLVFAYHLVTQTGDYLQVNLDADSGPLNTRNYRIVLEAIPLQGKTFLHLSYAYDYGFIGKVAAQTYFSTIARQKVGFTIAGKQADGSPRYISGMRGVVERNTMRYYLAIEAFLATPSGTSQAKLDKRLRDWFAATERYARQLHEVEQQDYLETKRSEYKRQQSATAG